MDLTYMPGELDYKNEKKGDGSGIKREHDSVDDFEHLDPESSPVDVQDFTSVGKFYTKADNPEKYFDSEHSMPDSLITDISKDGAGMQSKDKEIVENFIPSRPIDTEYQQIMSIDGISSTALDFGSSGGIPSAKKSNEDHLNASFIFGEQTRDTDKTEGDSDLLGLERKTKDSINNIQNVSLESDFKQLKDEHTIELDLKDNEKSMKEADALSQYEMKIEKKGVERKDEHVDLETHDSELIFKPEKHNLETFVATDPELIEPGSKLGKAEPDLPKPESHFITPEAESNIPKAETLKEEIKLYEEPKDNGPDRETPSRPFIAICPSKPMPVTTVKEVVKNPSISDLDDIIGPEDVFKRIGLDAWFTPERLHPIVEALVYWRDPKKSGVVFGGIMAILLSLCLISLISVVAYSSLFVVTGTICFRIYKNILQAVQKTSDGHPFKEYLDLELSLPQDKVREMADTAVVHINAAIVELRRLFLVEDLIDSIKFGVCLWCLTFVGAIFNGMTLVILAFVALFTVPKIYENNKTSIDTYIEMGRSKVAEITSKVKSAVPIGKKEPEKDKEQ